MSDTADTLTSKETQDAPGYDASSPPPSYQEQQPPPYSEDPGMYPPSTAEAPSTCLPATGDESPSDKNPEAPPDTTSAITSSAFDDKTVRRGFVRKVCTTLSFNFWLLISTISAYFTYDKQSLCRMFGFKC